MCVVPVFFNLWVMLVLADDQEVTDEEVLLHPGDETQKFEIAFKNWPINMYNDLRRLKTERIERGLYAPTPPAGIVNFLGCRE